MAELCKSEHIQDQESGRIIMQKCVLCEKQNKHDNADIYYHDCDQHQCSDCLDTQDVFDIMSEHELVKPEQAETPTRNEHDETLSKKNVNMQGLDICSQHSELFEFFCVKHETFYCRSCLQDIPCKNVHLVKTEAFKMNINLDETETSRKEVETFAKNVLKKMHSIPIAKPSDHEETLAQISCLKNSIKSNFECLIKQVNKTFVRAVADASDERQNSQSIIETVVHDLQSYEKLLSDLMRYGSKEQKYLAAYGVNEHIKLYKKVLEKQADEMYAVEFWFMRSEALTKLIIGWDSIGNIRLLKSPVATTCKGREKVDRLEQAHTLYLKQQDDDFKNPFYTGIDFFPDGRLAMVDNANSKLYIMTECLVTVSTCKLSDHPLSLAILSEKEVIVNFGSTMAIFNVSNTSGITLTKPIKTFHSYDTICPLDCTTLAGNAYNNDDPLKMITLTGDEKTIMNIPKRQFQLGESKCTYIKGKSILVLSVKFEDTLYLYETDKDYTTERRVSDERIKVPTGVCAGSDDTVFVCSNGTDTIVQVSLTGRVLCSLKLDMQNPNVVSMSKDENKLVVSNSFDGPRKVQILHILQNCTSSEVLQSDPNIRDNSSI